MIDHFHGNGISVSSNYNTVTADFVGIDSSGYFSKPNYKDGILVTGEYNVIGGTTASARNVVSGNAGAGIDLSGRLAIGNKIEGNYIGTDAYGFASEANQYGVLIQADAPAAISLAGRRPPTGTSFRATRSTTSGSPAPELRSMCLKETTSAPMRAGTPPASMAGTGFGSTAAPPTTRLAARRRATAT